jgi:PAS domain S-box-containing protein
VIGLVIPAHRRIQSALERVQYGRRFGRRQGLAWLGQELLRERDLDRLCEALLVEMEHGLDLERLNLLLVQGDVLVAVRPEPGLSRPFEADRLGERFWNSRFEILSGVSLPGGVAGASELLYTSGYRYVFPLLVRDARIGVVVTGLRTHDRPLDSDDVELARSLLDQAALAIENAQLLDQVQRQLEEVVTLQQHSEGILESSPAGIAVLDARDRVVNANLAFAALTGVARTQEIGRPLAELLPIDQLPAAGSSATRVISRDGQGRPRHLEVSVAPFRAGAAEDRRVLVVQDVSERVAMENALKNQDRLASLGVLAAGVAHEVNTPLTGISSYAQILLAETGADDPRRALLEKMERQTFRASRIVSNLLEFARKPGREAKSVDLGVLVADTADLLHERMTGRRVRLAWHPPAEPVRVVGSEGELQQVVTNLMMNAIDALAANGGGTLSVGLERGDGRVRIVVADDGPGIAPEHRDAIFQPFFTTKRDQGGTGLGLSICQGIVEQHGGRIELESLEPHGCRFIVELPPEPPSSAEPR